MFNRLRFFVQSSFTRSVLLSKPDGLLKNVTLVYHLDTVVKNSQNC